MSLRENPNPTPWTCPECGANNMACFGHCQICGVYFDHGDDEEDMEVVDDRDGDNEDDEDGDDEDGGVWPPDDDLTRAMRARTAARLSIDDDVVDDVDDSDDSDDEEVEIMAVVPAGDPVAEGVDVTELICPICLREFDNGEGVMILSCGGSHIMCKDCHGAIGIHDAQAAFVAYQEGAEVTMFEVVRRAEGADKCPVCRRMSHCAIEARAWSRPGSKNNAINVD